MDTAIAADSRTKAIFSADLGTPVVPGPAVVAFYDSKHVVSVVIGHVLAVGPIDELTGKPSITVAFPTIPADHRKLGGPRWSEGYTRLTGVPHHTHPDVQDGKVSAAWGGVGELVVSDPPRIDAPAGDGSNPVYARHAPAEQGNATTEALQEAVVAQQGKAPEGAHLSPLASEAGTEHTAVVTAKEAAGAYTPASSTDTAAAITGNERAETTEAAGDAGESTTQATGESAAAETGEEKISS